MTAGTFGFSSEKKLRRPARVLLVSYMPLANRPALSDLLLRYCAWIGALPLLPSREALQRCSQRFRGARAPSRPRYKKRRRPTAAKPHSRTIAARRTTCLEARCSVLNQFRPPEREPIVFWTIPASVDGSAVRVRQVRECTLSRLWPCMLSKVL